MSFARVIPLLFILTASGYNVDVDFPIVYSRVDPLKTANYFGYSVLLYSDSTNANKSWLIVGAPKGNYLRSTRDKFTYPQEPGVVYRCGIDEKCEEIRPKKIEGEKGTANVHGLQMKTITRMDRGWLGAAMSVKKSDGLLTVCAPRTSTSVLPLHPTLLSAISMHGMCYSGDVSSNALFTDGKIFWFYDFSGRYWYDPLCGFSVHYPSIKQSNKSKSSSGEANPIIGAPKHVETGSVYILHSRKMTLVDLPVRHDLAQFGYSVTSGYFFSKDKFLYAGGAPGWQYVGQVAIINLEARPFIVAQLYGNEAGEFFGASLAAGDLNGDGLDDLLIGAPHWGHDSGKVYAYLGSSKGRFETGASFEGTVDESYFGYAVACGDLDADGFNDIIVGAPWEEQGAIYVFNGGPDLKDSTTASQRITPAQLHRFNNRQKIERFGFSISEPVDVDHNGYPDIAVGAYKSGHAVLLRGKPVAETRLTIATVPDMLQRDTEEFLIKVCATRDGHNVQSAHDFEITIAVDEKYRRTRETFLEFSFKRSIVSCVEANITVTENVQNFIEPIGVLARHNFLPSTEATIFCKTCAVERRNSDLSTEEIFLPFDIDCGEDKACNSNVSATATFYGVRDSDTWVVSSNDVSFEVALENSAEPAYLTVLVFVLPQGVALRSILPFCHENATDGNLTVTCDVGNPLGEGEKRTVRLDLDMRNLVDGSLHGKELHFFASIETRSANDGTANITKVLKLVSEVALSLDGRAIEESYYLPESNGTAYNVSFHHAYEVRKLGATPVEIARLVIKVPMVARSPAPLLRVFEPRLYASGESYECSSENIVFLETRENEATDAKDARETKRKAPRRRATDYGMTTDLSMKTVRKLEESETSNSVNENIIYLNCSTRDVECSVIVCDLSFLKTLEESGKVVVQFLLNVRQIEDNFANDKTVLKFGTDAFVEIVKPEIQSAVNGTRSDMEIVTLFYKMPKAQKVQLWIILLSVSVGLILLFIVVIILSTFGFFERSSKHELEQLKASEVAEEEVNETTDLPVTENTQ